MQMGLNYVRIYGEPPRRICSIERIKNEADGETDLTLGFRQSKQIRNKNLNILKNRRRPMAGDFE